MLRADATRTAPALVLRPWCAADALALVGTSFAVGNEADAVRWLGDRERAWAAGERFGFAVLEAQPDGGQGRLLGSVVLKEIAPDKPSAEVGYWTAAHARGRGVAPHALEALTGWAFDTFQAGGLRRLELLHQVDNLASCRVAQKSRYDFDRTLPAAPPTFPLEGHLHTRHPTRLNAIRGT